MGRVAHDIERLLPEDLVKAQVRATDGSFKIIETGSVGEKSTAILSLLLSAGDQLIIMDQPEDDLDNQYVYNVVVDPLREGGNAPVRSLSPRTTRIFPSTAMPN